MDYSEIIDLVLDNIKKVVFPEDWLSLDLTLSKQDIFALLLINRHGEIIMSRIADYVNISMSTATGIIDRLVKNDYCIRRRSETDRRVVVISLTDKAKKIISTIKEMGTGYFDRIMQVLTSEEQQFLTSIITKIFAALSENKGTAGTDEQQISNIESIAIE